MGTDTIKLFKEKFKNFEEKVSELNIIFNKNVVEKKKARDEKKKKEEEKNKGKGGKVDKKADYEVSNIKLDRGTEIAYSAPKVDASNLFDMFLSKKITVK